MGLSLQSLLFPLPRNDSQRFLTWKLLLCDTGRDKTPLFVPDPCQPSHGSRELTPSEPREKQGHNSQRQEQSTVPPKDNVGIKARNSRGKNHGKSKELSRSESSREGKCWIIPSGIQIPGFSAVSLISFQRIPLDTELGGGCGMRGI